MAKVSSFKHIVKGSMENQDTDAMQTIIVQFPVNASSANTAPQAGDEWVNDNETARGGWYPDAAPLELSKSYSKTIGQDAAFDDFMTYFGWWACCPAASAATTQIGSTGYYYAAASTNGIGNVLAFSMQDAGNPDAEDDAENVNATNCVVESFNVTWGSGAPVSCSVNVRGGGRLLALGGAPSDVTERKHKPFSGAHSYLLSSLTTGLSGTGVAHFANAPSSAQVVTDTRLAGTVTDYSTSIHGGSLTITNSFDVQGSLSPGAANYVATADQWRQTGQIVELTLDVKGGTTLHDLMRAEHDAHTPRGFELCFLHPTAMTTGAYSGWNGAGGTWYPVFGSWTPTNNGMGPKDASVTYRSHGLFAFKGTIGQLADTFGD